jgi:hypothetical protein
MTQRRSAATDSGKGSAHVKRVGGRFAMQPACNTTQPSAVTRRPVLQSVVPHPSGSLAALSRPIHMQGLAAIVQACVWRQLGAPPAPVLAVDQKAGRVGHECVPGLRVACRGQGRAGQRRSKGRLGWLEPGQNNRLNPRTQPPCQSGDHSGLTSPCNPR